MSKAFVLTRANFTRVIQGNGLIFVNAETEPAELDLLGVASCMQGFMLIFGCRDFVACYPGAAVENIRAAVRLGEQSGDRVLVVASLSELAFVLPTVHEAIEHLVYARNLLVADILAVEEGLVLEMDRRLRAAGVLKDDEPQPLSVGKKAKSPVPNTGNRAASPDLGERREIAEIRRLAARRAETDAVIGPRLELLELVEHNLHQFMALANSVFYRNWRIHIDKGLMMQSKWREAEHASRMLMVHVEEGTFGIDHWWHAVFAIRLGHALLRQGKVESARCVLEPAAQILLEWVPDPATSVFKEEWDLLQMAMKEVEIDSRE